MPKSRIWHRVTWRLRFERAFGVDGTLMRYKIPMTSPKQRSRAKDIRVQRYQPRPAAW